MIRRGTEVTALHSDYGLEKGRVYVVGEVKFFDRCCETPGCEGKMGVTLEGGIGTKNIRLYGTIQRLEILAYCTRCDVRPVQENGVEEWLKTADAEGPAKTREPELVE